MRLALSEGRLSKWKELRDELTPRELTELIAFWDLEPWGDRRADIRSALMAATISASNGLEVDLEKLMNYIDVENEEFEKCVSPMSAAATISQIYPSTIK